jgi:hypothetical protein
VEYLEDVLQHQQPAPEVEAALRSRRAQIESVLAGGWLYEEPRFYYGRSLGKKTLYAKLYIIRHLKVWKYRHGVPISSFVLELPAERAPRSFEQRGLGERLDRIPRFPRDSFMEARPVDPGNSNNVDTNDLNYAQKLLVTPAAEGHARERTGRMS